MGKKIYKTSTTIATKRLKSTHVLDADVHVVFDPRLTRVVIFSIILLSHFGRETRSRYLDTEIYGASLNSISMSFP